MPKITVDGKEIEVDDGLTVLQACEQAGAEIPRFCYHERLAIAGNCRMCLVDIEKSPKPVASCALNVSDGMVISTNNDKVKAARNGVMEFLLINHPLDCPICDQGGECDLQDQAFKYGKGISNYHENKRAVADKDLGPLIQTYMTRCIHCTRCVRFTEDIAGIEEMGAIGRGEHMEITSYLSRTLDSELSGNMIDLCPVGALTSKPYKFKARNWELHHTESVDVMDAMGANIRLDSRGNEIMRVLPVCNDEINEEWISDKTRFSYDGLKYQRLDRPYIKRNGKFEPITWQEALAVAADKLKNTAPDKIAAIAGDLTDCETMFATKMLFNQLGSGLCDANMYGYKFDFSARGNYLFNTTISGIKQSDLILIIGANPREDAPVLNSIIGRQVRFKRAQIYGIGAAKNQTYPIEDLGSEPSVLQNILAGKHAICAKLAAANKPMIIIGDGVYSREDAFAMMSLIQEIATKYGVIKDSWNGFNILHKHAATVGAIELGFMLQGEESKNVIDRAKTGEIEVLYLLGADELEIEGTKAFVIYQGHHGDKGASNADLILPGAAYTEKDAIYVNLEGRAQYAYAAVSPPGEARLDWQIILAIAKAAEVNLKFTDLHSLRASLRLTSDIFSNIGKVPANNIVMIDHDGAVSSDAILPAEANFFMANAINRASVTMAKCTESRKALRSNDGK